MKEYIHLLHTNDLHSHFENWPKIRRFLALKQNTYHQDGSTVITSDLGDFMDRFHPLTDATNGLANIEIMNQVAYDYATIGNNEGITNSQEELNHLYDSANFKILLANLLDKETKKLPKWAMPYDVYKTEAGTRIGFIGLTTPINLTYEPFGWFASDPMDCLKKWLPEIRQQTDIIVLLSHLGLPDDKRIAETFPEIDVIIESHTHHLFETGLMWRGCLLAAAGRFGEYIGEIDLVLENGHIASKIAKTYQTSKMEDKTRDIIEVAGYKMEGENLLKAQLIGNLTDKLEKETSLMSLTLKAMKDYAGVDVALLNTGIILTDLEKGPVTKKDLHECLPHPMNLIKVTLKGKDVKRLVYEIERMRDYLYNFKIVGMKFRGKNFGEICYDGLNFSKKTREVTWCQEEIDDEKDYQLVTVDHLSFLPFFPTIEIAGDVKILSPDFLRTILGNYIKKSNSNN